MNIREIEQLLGAEAKSLLQHEAQHFRRTGCTCPARISSIAFGLNSDRSPNVLRNMQTLFGHGRLAGTGYVSILPVDQGIEHSAGASFAPNPDYFDPENICQARHRRRLQRRRLHARRHGQPSPASMPTRFRSCAQDQPQRIPVVSQQLRSDSLRQRQASLRHGRGRRRRHRLFRLRRIEAADSGNLPRLPASARTGHVHHPLVLPAQQRLQDRRKKIITSPPI